MRVLSTGRVQCAVLLLALNGCGLIGGDEGQASPGAGNAAGSGGAGSSAGGQRAGGGQAGSGPGAGAGGGAGAGASSGSHSGGFGGLGAPGGAGSVAGASSAGTAGSQPVDPGCASAINFDGDLKTSEVSQSGKLVANVRGDLTVDSTKGLADLRCLQTVSGYVSITIESGGLSALGRLRSVGTSLKIEGNSTIRNLSDLQSLGAVGDALIISKNSALVDLSGSLLGYVGGTLSILENPALLNLKGLERLDGMPRVSIADNVSLQNLDGLSNLTRRGVELYIGGNSALVSVAGLGALVEPRSVIIRHSPLLHDLKGLEGWTSIGTATIDSCDTLVNLAGLRGTTQINSLVLSDNASLRDLDGLENLETLLEATISGNPKLENIDALGTSMVTVANFSLEAPALTTLEGLSKALDFNRLEIGALGVANLNDLRNLRTAGSLTIKNSKLKDLSGLGKASLWELTIDGNTELTSLTGLSSINQEMQTVRVINNPKLSDLTGLSMVRTISQFSVDGNATMTSLAGLDNLKTVDSLNLSDLPVLSKLAALAPLKTITTGATIRQNPMLSNCEAQQFVTRCGAPATDLQDNGPCN